MTINPQSLQDFLVAVSALQPELRPMQFNGIVQNPTWAALVALHQSAQKSPESAAQSVEEKPATA